MMKKCKKCGAQKELTAFYVRTNGKISSPCKTCTIAMTKARYQGPQHESIKAADRAYATAKRARIREAVFAAYGGYKCACCGESEQKFLTIDHVKNDGATFRRQIAGTRTAAGYVTYRWLLKHNFPSGYQVLCMNCNHGKRMNAGVCPHQARRNDQSKDVGPSGPKRTAPMLKLVG